MLVSRYVWSIRQHFGHPWLSHSWLSRINSPVYRPCSLKHLWLNNHRFLRFFHILNKYEMVQYSCHPQPYRILDSLLKNEEHSSVRFEFGLLLIIHIICILFFVLIRVMCEFLFFLLIKKLFLFRWFFLFLATFCGFSILISEIPHVYNIITLKLGFIAHLLYI